MPDAFPLKRDTTALHERQFDVLVVGGGIYGAWCAYDAALRGLAVALIEKHDWGAGTSSASSKLIHGGLRYLEHMELSLVRHALTERRTLARLAPHLVRPINFVLPVWKGARVGAFKLSAGLALYDLLAFRRQPVQRHRYFRRERLLRRYPFLCAPGLKGAFRYGDCQEDDARLAMVVAAAAQATGAIAANRIEAEKLIEENGGVRGVTVRDLETGAMFEIRARAVIHAAGPWAARLLGTHAPPMRLIKGTHLVLPAIAHCHSAFVLTAPQDGRAFFVVPWYGRSLLGTTESEVDDPDTARPNGDEVRYLLGAANAWLPGLGWTEDQIIARFCGTRALQPEHTRDLSAITREFSIVCPRPNLLMPLGGKYTTARHDAERVVDRIGRILHRHLPACATDRAPLPGAPDGHCGEWFDQGVRTLAGRGVDEEAASTAAQRHGTRIARLLELIAEQPALARRIHPQAPFLRAEAVLAVRDEMARSLEDVLRRRMPLLLLARREAGWLTDVARLIAPALGWDETESLRQVKALMPPSV